MSCVCHSTIAAFQIQKNMCADQRVLIANTTSGTLNLESSQVVCIIYNLVALDKDCNEQPPVTAGELTVGMVFMVFRI